MAWPELVHIVNDGELQVRPCHAGEYGPDATVEQNGERAREIRFPGRGCVQRDSVGGRQLGERQQEGFGRLRGLQPGLGRQRAAACAQRSAELLLGEIVRRHDHGLESDIVHDRARWARSGFWRPAWPSSW